MSEILLTDTHKSNIIGILNCYDRVIINGTPGTFGYSKGMTSFFYQNNFKIFDFAKIFKPITEAIKENAEKMAHDNHLTIEYIRKSGSFRKEERISEILKERGCHEGLVHIFSAVELSDTYDPWHDNVTTKTFFRFARTKCLHYYFYFVDKELGLCFLRVSTIAPFKVIFYFNGHNLLETKMKKAGIEYIKEDNAFTYISDFTKAQELSNNFKVEDLHKALEAITKRYCPLPEDWGLKFNYTISQVEYALDIVFKTENDLKPLYDNIIKTAMHTVTPDNIANFLGKRFSVLYEGECGSKYNKRILGTRIKHQMGEVSIKAYDKFGRVLRIEVTSNNVTKFKTFREVRERDGTVVEKMAPVKKSIYSLFILSKIMRDAANRYLKFISGFNDPTEGLKKIDKVVDPVIENGRKYKGFNFFDKDDEKILSVVADGRFTVSGITNKEIRRLIPEKTSSQISRILKRLRLHGLIKKVGKTYKYYLNATGRSVIVAGLAFKNMSFIPSMV